MTHQYLPEFASQWMRQWKRAAPELARIRDRELRAMNDAETVRAASVLDMEPRSPELHRENGLVIQQRWFMRQRLLEFAPNRER